MIDIERPRGTWVRVVALMDEPDPLVGIPRPIVREICATGPQGRVELSTEEVNALAQHFEESYYRWRRTSWK